MSLDKEFQYYKDNQEELVRRYENKFIVIKGEEVVGDYDTEIEAYESAKKNFPVGTFLIQHCLPGQESYTQSFHSRVAFQ
ncbi:MAG: DUF5678 domain-containing protein [Nitrospirales bacterium]